MKLSILILVVVAALAAGPAAQASDYPGVRTFTLESKLPTPVSVYCTQNTSWSFAYINDKAIYLGQQECDTLAGRPSSMSFPRAAEVLYHEWWHVAFRETNEQNTECGSWTVLRYALRRYWGLTRAQAQEDYRQATQWSPYAPLPCSPNQDDPIR